MTDKVITFAGAVPLETDLAYAQRGVETGLGYAIEAILGSGTFVAGLGCAPTSPASMQVNIARGMLSALSVVDATPFGSLPANPAGLVKIGVNTASTPLTFVAPTSPGTSQNFLIEASLGESDADPVVLPYYNATNPTIGFNGPGNSGVPQSTHRIQRVSIQVLPGAPAAAGSQTTPSVTAGWVPLYVATLNAGQTSITASSFSVHPQAPFIPFTLPQLAPGFGRVAVFTTSGNWTVPLGVTQAKVTVVGGGAGGSSCFCSSGTTNASGGGGGGGGAAIKIVAVTPGSVIPATVGNGGASGFGGGSSSFGTFLSATGGASTAFIATNVSPGGSGGNGAGGTINLGGGIGSDGQSGSFLFAGNGGSSIFGGAGRAGAHAGQPGTAFGAGGGGAYDTVASNTTFAGGAGANGIVIVEY